MESENHPLQKENNPQSPAIFGCFEFAGSIASVVVKGMRWDKYVGQRYKNVDPLGHETCLWHVSTWESSYSFLSISPSHVWKKNKLCARDRNFSRPLVGTKRQTISQWPSHQSPLGPVAALQGTKHIFLTMGSGHPYPTMPAFTNVSFSNLTWLLMSLMSDASHS